MSLGSVAPNAPPRACRPGRAVRGLFRGTLWLLPTAVCYRCLGPDIWDPLSPRSRRPRCRRRENLEESLCRRDTRRCASSSQVEPEFSETEPSPWVLTGFRWRDFDVPNVLTGTIYLPLAVPENASPGNHFIWLPIGDGLPFCTHISSAQHPASFVTSIHRVSGRAETRLPGKQPFCFTMADDNVFCGLRRRGERDVGVGWHSRFQFVVGIVDIDLDTLQRRRTSDRSRSISGFDCLLARRLQRKPTGARTSTALPSAAANSDK